MTSLKDLLAQRAALDEQIQATTSKERAGAIEKVKALMAEYGLSVADLSTVRAAKAEKVSTVAVKYRNKSTGETWSGRGLQPRWLKAAITAGAKLEEFLV